MKFRWRKSGLSLTAGLLGVIAVANSTLAAESFHAGGVGACDGCHTMHNSQGGLPGPEPSAWLLQAADPSSICLNCHAGAGGSDSPSVLTPDGSALSPGGDFYWLTKDFVWSDGSSLGESHGHNIVASDFGLVADITRAQAPGGSYPSAYLGCTSCHDPHGRVTGGTENGMAPISESGSYGAIPAPGSIRGNYRLLGDSRYDGGKLAQGFAFTNDAPVARQDSLNRFGESDTSHVDYGSGMSEWCVNCHTTYQSSEHSQFKHSSGIKLSDSIVNNYDTYIKTGDFSGNAATAYLQFVPFERGTTDPTFLDPLSTQGPDVNSQVMCLTCHRAHASAFRSAGRWDFEAALLADSHPAFGDVGISGNDVFYSYYGRDILSEFGSGQKAFCEKCHDVNGP